MQPFHECNREKSIGDIHFRVQEGTVLTGTFVDICAAKERELAIVDQKEYNKMTNGLLQQPNDNIFPSATFFAVMDISLS